MLETRQACPGKFASDETSDRGNCKTWAEMLVSSCLSHKLVTCLFATATATTTSSSTPTTYTTTSATANHHHHQHYHHDLYTTSTTCSVNIRQSPRVSAAARVSCVLPLIRMHSTQHCGEALNEAANNHPNTTTYCCRASIATMEQCFNAEFVSLHVSASGCGIIHRSLLSVANKQPNLCFRHGMSP